MLSRHDPAWMAAELRDRATIARRCEDGRLRLTYTGHLVRVALAVGFLFVLALLILRTGIDAGTAGGLAAATLLYNPTARSAFALLGWFPLHLYGAIGDGVADDRPALSDAATAAGTAGIVVGKAGKTYLLASGHDGAGTAGFMVPQGLSNWRLVGNGCTFKLTADCPTLLLQNRTGDDQTFANFAARDFKIDGNNIGGQYTAALFGSDLSTYARKINLRNITFEDIEITNVPVGVQPSPADPNPKRAHILFDIQDTVAGHAGTQYTATDLTCRRIKMAGGNFGIMAVGQNASGGAAGDKNVFFDRVHLEDCKWDSGQNFVGIGQVYSSGFQFGSNGYGGTLTMIRCEAARSGDVDLEINNFLRAIVRDCEFRDASQAKVLCRNYNTTWVAAGNNIHRQHYTFDTVALVDDLLVPSEAQGATNIQEGFWLATGTYDLGRVDIVNCSNVVRQQLAVGSRQRAVLGGARILNIDIVDRRGDVQANPAAGTSPNAVLALSVPSTPGAMKLRHKTRVRWRGTKSGASNYQPRFIGLGGSGELDVSADSTAEVDVTLTGASTGMIGVLVDPTTLVGEHGRVRITNLGDSTGNIGIQVTPTNCSKFVFRGADFGGWAAGNTEWFVSSGAIRRAVKFDQPRRITHPRATTVPTTTPSPILVENTSGHDANLMLTATGGTISSVRRTTDGGTTYESALAVGAVTALHLPVAHGEGWEITFTGTLTGRQSYVR